MSGPILSPAERFERARRMEQAVELATDPDPEKRISAYEAARRCNVSQSAISQNRAYRAWKNSQTQEEHQQ